jgi:hypothetical protein
MTSSFAVTFDPTHCQLGRDVFCPYPARSQEGSATDYRDYARPEQFFDSPRSSPSLTSHSVSTTSSSSLSFAGAPSSNYRSIAAGVISPFTRLSPEILDPDWSDRDGRLRESPEPLDYSQGGLGLSGAAGIAMR